MKRNRLVFSLAIAAFMASPLPGFAQVCVDPPPIGGTPSVGAAPAGWSVAANTPDIVAGNGLWPGGGYTISDIGGTSTSGGSMGLFLSEPSGYVESWQTTLTGLTSGVTYQVAVEWQQATLTPNSGGTGWSGGHLRITVDGNSTDYTSTGSVAGDAWQLATKVFTATGPTANLVLGHTPEAVYGMVVADSGGACSIANPPPPQVTPPAIIPTLSEWSLMLLGLMLAAAATWRMRKSRA